MGGIFEEMIHDQKSILYWYPQQDCLKSSYWYKSASIISNNLKQTSIWQW